MSSAAVSTRDPISASRSFASRYAVLLIAAAKLVFQLATATRYGYYGDEFYYYACSRHLQWGYYDHPPFVAFMMWISRHLFGNSLLATRIFPSLCGALLVWLAADLSRALGGSRFAQVLTATCVACAPVYMLFFHFFSMNAFECGLWTALARIAVFAIAKDKPNAWLLFGLLLGLSLENKYSVAVFVSGLILGLLFVPARRHLLTIQFWLGMLIALLMLLPNLLWMSNHGWPFLQWQSAIRQRHDFLDLSIGRYAWQQALLTGATVIVWTSGLVALLLSRTLRNYRFLAIASALTFITFYIAGGRVLYPAPLFAILFAAGAVWLEQVSLQRRWIRPAIAIPVVAAAAILAPCFVPILPISRVAAYEDHLHLGLPIQIERGRNNTKLPFDFAFESGWPTLVETTARVYKSLTPEQRGQASILAFNYQTAGAIDLLGPQYGLPPAISTHMTYHEWGPRNAHGQVLIVISDSFPSFWCKHYEPGATVNNPYTYTNAGLAGPIVNVCYGLKFDLQQQWGGLPWY